jgi:hypothetical protein
MMVESLVSASSALVSAKRNAHQCKHTLLYVKSYSMWTVDGHKKARHFLKGQTLGVYTLLVSFTPIFFAA